ncbi:MAG: hypothetical protein KGM42_15205 [Hyphomicrobiales bacterium]|nr:hypothetical protein [Hyphomicrobiales bacterium]
MFQSRRPPGARYIDLKNRLRKLEAIYDDSVKLDRVLATGRYFKLAVATARAHEKIEREFGAGAPKAGDPPANLDRRRKQASAISCRRPSKP